MYTIEANVELPCEECDYDGVCYSTKISSYVETNVFQIIPRSRTLREYDNRDFLDEEPVFSSFTYLIDLTRISGSLLGLDRLPPSDVEIAVNNADAMLVNWKLHLPREKQGVVDKNEELDEILFFAQQQLQVYVTLLPAVSIHFRS